MTGDDAEVSYGWRSWTGFVANKEVIAMSRMSFQENRSFLALISVLFITGNAVHATINLNAVTHSVNACLTSEGALSGRLPAIDLAPATATEPRGHRRHRPPR